MSDYYIIFADSRDAALLWAFHVYLVPTIKFVRNDLNEKKSTSKFTIKDSQESIVYVAAAIGALEDQIEFCKVCKHYKYFVNIIIIYT